MKHVVLGFVLGLISILALAAVLIVSGRGQKERELHNALQSAVRETLQTLEESGEGAGTSDDELEQQIRNRLERRLKADERKRADQNFDLNIRVQAADAEKGLLSCSVKENYTHLSGKIGCAQAEATAIIEEDAKENFYEVKYLLPGQTRTYKRYVQKKGEQLILPEKPKMAGKKFSCWRDEKGKPLDPKMRVQKDYVFLADF